MRAGLPDTRFRQLTAPARRHERRAGPNASTPVTSGSASGWASSAAVSPTRRRSCVEIAARCRLESRRRFRPSARPTSTRSSSPPARCPTSSRNAAAQVGTRIGLQAPGAFDLNCACAGFCYGLGTASDLVRAGTSQHVLVIGAEKLSHWMDWRRPLDLHHLRRRRRGRCGGPGRKRGRGSASGRWSGAVTVASTKPSGCSPSRARSNKIFQGGARPCSAGPPPQIRAGGTSRDRTRGPHPRGHRRLQSPIRPTCASSTRWPSGCARKAPARDMRVAHDIVALRQHVLGLQFRWRSITCAPPGRISRGDVMLLVGFGSGLSYAGQVVVCP